MIKATLGVAACATLLWAGTALGTQTPQEKCDQARVTAWKTYVSCVDTVVATDAGCEENGSCRASFDEFAAFAKCRHTYFKTWTTFQKTTTLLTSTCHPSAPPVARFTDNGDGTVTDNLSALVWEQKTNDASVHDGSNLCTWSTGSPYVEDGTAFTGFLGPVNSGGGFAGANGWRLPTLAELQTIVLDFACTTKSCSCGAGPCIDATFGPTQSTRYWSATSYVPGPSGAWLVDFLDGGVNDFIFAKTQGRYVRAVRGGL